VKCCHSRCCCVEGLMRNGFRLGDVLARCIYTQPLPPNRKADLMDFVIV
jgi:hypothetical protein